MEKDCKWVEIMYVLG